MRVTGRPSQRHPSRRSPSPTGPRRFPTSSPTSCGTTRCTPSCCSTSWNGRGDRSAGGLNWDAKGWVGGDRDRLWFRTEGETNDRHLGAAEAQLFYGRAVARWWDVVVGVRQDVRPGPAQTWVAFGVQGLAPYWFEVEATGYVSDGGQTAVRLEVEYELLLTNHLVLQPLVELNLYGKSNVERGIGAGLSSADIGLRMRYEFRRELAPYVGVTWNNTFGETADLAETAGETSDGPTARRRAEGLVLISRSVRGARDPHRHRIPREETR